MAATYTKCLLISAIVLLGSCHKEKGCYVESGPVDTRFFDLPDFHTINHQVAADFVLNSGPHQQVKITGDRNILKALEKESYVENGVWNLKFMSCVQNYEPLLVELTLPNYVAFTNDGSGTVSSGAPLVTNGTFSIAVGGSGDLNLTLNDMQSVDVELKGSGNLKLSGNTISETLAIKGEGVIDCFDLAADHATVSISGTGNCMVQVNQTLQVEIKGNGTVYYKGYPVITESISGVGSIIDAN